MTMLVGLLPPVLIAAAGNIDNDICDRKSDRRWKADRPLAAGLIPTGTASAAGWSLTTAGLAVALAAGVFPFGIAAGVVALLAIYNRILSSLPLAGNVAVAASFEARSPTRRRSERSSTTARPRHRTSTSRAPARIESSATATS